MTELFSIREAASNGIQRIRKPIWANPLDHLKIYIIDGKPGVWLHLYAPFNKECNGRDPVDILSLKEPLDTPEFEVYDGPLPDTEEYKRAAAKYDRCLEE